MAATNIDEFNATVIASIPYSIVVSADDVQSSPGATHPLWWVYTNEDHQLLAMYAMGSIPGHTYPVGHTFNVPIIQLFTGTPGSLTAYPPAPLSINDTGAIQVGVITRPKTLYIKLTVDGGGFGSEPVDDPLYLRVLPGRNISADAGSYLILSDQSSGTQAWPAQLFGADGKLKQSVTLVPGEQGYMFDDGTFAILNELVSPEPLHLYRPDLSLIAIVSIAGGAGALGGDAVTGDGTSTVFVAKSTASVAAVITAVDKVTGATGSTWTLPADSKTISAIGVSRDRTVLYYQATAGTNNNAVHRYDLVGSAPLTDLAADNTYNALVQGIQVLKDGSIAVGYFSSIGDGKIIRYNTAGTILNTYIVPNGVAINMFSPYTDDPTSLLVWTMDDTATSGSPTFSRFYLVNTTTGVFTQLGPDVPIFEDGVYAGADSTSAPITGIPFSCPLLVPRVPIVVPDTPPTANVTAPLPCCDTTPGNPNPGPVPIPIKPNWTAQCRGGGSVPVAADIVNSEDWAA